jgi:hypothetical protein
MTGRSITRAISVIILSLAFCLFILNRANDVTQAEGLRYIHLPSVSDEQEKPAEQVYKNIQVLNGLAASELDGAMYYMSASLGVGCTHCHTNPWESDAKPSKLAARKMILMTRNINKENFSGNPVVNCYTCHRGQPQTVTMPPASQPAWQMLDAEPAAAPPTPAMPSAEQVIDKYIRAIGGAAAINKLKTRVSRGTRTTTNKMTPPLSVPLEVYQTAANNLLAITNHPGGVVHKGFNGTVGWLKDARGQREITGKELAEEKRGADFFRYMKIKESYPSARLLGKEKVGDREAFVIGATSRDDSREKLYFDTETGLLIRRYVTFKTALGSIPEVTDFADYKDVDGIKLPFTISWSRPPFTSTEKLVEIKLDVPIDDRKFDPPAVK